MTPSERLLGKIQFVEGCWEFQGATNNSGYTSFWLHPKRILSLKIPTSMTAVGIVELAIENV